MEEMQICVAGAGAIGGVIAARLAAAGHRVSLIARGAHLTAIRRQGLALVDHLAGGTRSVYQLEADADPSALAERIGPQDLVVLATKTTGLIELLPKLAPLMHRDTVVMPAINGLPWWYFKHEGGRYDGQFVEAVDPSGALLRALDPSHLIGCVVHLAGEVRAPGEIHHTGGLRLLIGEIDRRLPEPLTERVMQLARLLQSAGLEALPSGEIRRDVWIKLIGNLSFNPVAALSGALMNEICADQGLVDVLVPMLNEGTAVASALGVTIPMTAEQRIDIARQLGNAKISMLQDFEAGRTPELGAIVGAVIELARWCAIPVPTVRMVHALAYARARHLGLLGA